MEEKEGGEVCSLAGAWRPRMRRLRSHSLLAFDDQPNLEAKELGAGAGNPPESGQQVAIFNQKH